MSFVVKKRDLTDPAQLQALIVEHADDLERGLTILDSRLFLGHATIDVVGLDTDSTLVLIAVGLIADEAMFLRAVEAYSWCLEYPESIRQLYPAALLSTARPPRVMFIVERVPDAFHRKIKQLGFQEVDCIEFRYLDVDGTPAVYFENLARLRRNAVTAPSPSDQSATPTPPVASGRSTSLKLQKLLGAERGDREAAPIVRMVHRAPVRPESKPLSGATRTERSVAPRRDVEEPAPPRPGVDPAPAQAAAPIALPDVVAVHAVAEALAEVSDVLGVGVGASDAMVEAFVTIERPAKNGHVVALPSTTHEVAPGIEEHGLENREPELAVERREPRIEEPERVVRGPEPMMTKPAMPAAVTPAPESDEAAEIVLDVVAAELSATAGPLEPEPPNVAPPVASEPEAGTVAAAISAPAPELGLGLELERPLVDQETESTTTPSVSAAPAVAEPEGPMTEPSIEADNAPAVTVTAPTPATSVFARRPANAAATRVEPAFAKPSGPFATAPTLKRPRTIAPPPSDGQPIAGGPKLATGANRIAPPAAANEPAVPVEPANAPAQTIGEVQFPNDGLLTRQWMEFLNQMAAGK